MSASPYICDKCGELARFFREWDLKISVRKIKDTVVFCFGAQGFADVSGAGEAMVFLLEAGVEGCGVIIVVLQVNQVNLIRSIRIKRFGGPVDCGR